MGDKTIGVEALSDRQKQILRLVAQHLQAKEVARILKISKHTVDTHTEEARKRLNVATSREAARILTTYEAELEGLPTEYRPLPMGIPEADAAVPVSGPEQVRVPEGMWAGFSRRLKALTTVQWVGVILAVAILSAVLMGGLVIVLLGILEILQRITHFAGWRA